MTMRLQFNWWCVLVVLPVGLLYSAPAYAAPDPSLSTCEFPEILPAVKQQLSFDVVVQDANGPIEGIQVNMSIVVESGSLVPDQLTQNSAWTNLEGRAVLKFNGILGHATIHLVSNAGGVELCTSPSYHVFTGPKLALYAQPKSSSSCGTPPTSPCSAFNTAGQLHVGYDVYVIVGQGDPSSIGMGGLGCGVRYGTGLGRVAWTTCGNATFEIPFGDWPASDSGMELIWSTPCLKATTVSADEGVQTVAGSFYVYAYSEDLLELTPNIGDPRYTSALYYDCTLEGHEFDFTDDAIGKVRFSDLALPGYNPCPGNGGAPPPPPPPPPPPWGPDQISMILHIGDVTGPRFACSSAPTSEQNVVTHAAASPEGTARYFVYLLAAPSDSNDTNQGLLGMQLGINYEMDTPGQRGLLVNSWHACSELEFPGTGWPGPDTGNTITWSLGNCQNTALVAAGYFYVTAYGASTMSVEGFPGTGVVKAADCSGAEFVLNQILNTSEVGWISLGGGRIGPDTDGCNPALEPCDRLTPATPTTWGKLKQRFTH